MFNLFKSDSSKNNLERIQTKIIKTTENFSNRLEEIEKFADSIYENASNKIIKFKRIAHALDILISDKDKYLNMILANKLQCQIMYGLPHICTDEIEGRLESDIINDYIESTGKWNSFVESINFNIDEIVKECMMEKSFVQIGYVADKEIILKTIVKPHIEDNIFDGVLTTSIILDKNQFKDMYLSEPIYDNNKYTVFEI